MIVQLHPAIPLSTPKGNSLAHFVIDYGQESHLLWVCFQDDTGECWTWPNPDIRAQKNESMGRKLENRAARKVKTKRELIEEVVGLPLPDDGKGNVDYSRLCENHDHPADYTCGKYFRVLDAEYYINKQKGSEDD